MSRIRRWGGEDVKLPQVDVLYAYQDLNVGLFQAAIDLGAKGIVLAGFGAATGPTQGPWRSGARSRIATSLSS